jgi:aspartate aminotransferase
VNAGRPGLAARVRRLGLSPTVAMAARAHALRARGVRVFDFTVGEPDQPTPAHIVAAGKAALDAGWTKYAPAQGAPELREAIAERYRADCGLRLALEQVVVTVGGKQALAVLYQAVLDRASEVVVPVPAWPTFAEAVRIAGARPIPLRLSAGNGFQLSARAVARAITPRTRAVVVNSPSNPTGAIVAAAELARIAHLARKHGFWLLYDDTYRHLAADGRLVVVGTASKSYCMTGWRVGWLIGPPALAAACAALNSHSVQGPATFAQRAAAAALSGPQDAVRELAAEYRSRRDLVYPQLASLPAVSCVRPQGGFYVFPDVSRCLSRALPDTLALCARLLEEQAVAVVPGEGFSAPGHLRLSFAAARDELQEGLRRLASFLCQQGSPGSRR